MSTGMSAKAAKCHIVAYYAMGRCNSRLPLQASDDVGLNLRLNPTAALVAPATVFV